MARRDTPLKPVSRLRRLAAGSALALGGVVAYDVTQRHHAILRNFPIVGHFRYILETFGPELRQYIVTSNNEERPFSRDQRSWVYPSSKLKPNTVGFGTDNEMENGLGYLIIKHDARPFPAPAAETHRLRARVPAARREDPRRGPRAPARVPPAVGREHQRDELRRAVGAGGRGAQPRRRDRARACRTPARAACPSTTATAASSSSRSAPGTSAAATPPGGSTSSALLETIARGPVRALEIKLSQGAKPGVGGMLPAAKMTPEIAAIRGVEAGQGLPQPAEPLGVRRPSTS